VGNGFLSKVVSPVSKDKKKHSPHYWTPVNEVAIVGECISWQCTLWAHFTHKESKEAKVEPKSNNPINPRGLYTKSQVQTQI